jgi:hypothetical protein
MNRVAVRHVVTGAGVLALAVAVTAILRGQEPAGAPQHVQLTRDEDYERTRKMLGLSGPPPAGAVSSDPATFNEAVANPYPNLPDPLRLNSGQRVTTRAQWNTRRAELVEVFEREVYGRIPKVTPKVTWEVYNTLRETNGDVPVITKQLVGRVDNSTYPALTVNILATVSTPANATGPVPIIMSLSGAGFGFPAYQPVDGKSVPEPTTVCRPPNAPPPPAPGGRAGAPAAGRGGPPVPQGPTSQQQALALGWGYALINTGSVQADNGQGLTCGIIGLVNKGQPRKQEDWGVLAAWGWGAGRLLDYLETDKAADAKRVGLYGHSRWGKATLVGTVNDPRFAIAYVSSSGQGGAKLFRRKYGETIDNVANTYYYWMGANFIKYAGNWDKMPVDAHEYIALMAPRPVFFSGGNDPQRNADGSIATTVNAQGQTVVAQAYDAWVDPRGNFMAAAGAAPVYELLGKKGLGVKEFPPVDTDVISGDLGFRQHSGGHTSGPAWQTFYKFAAKYFGPAK